MDPIQAAALDLVMDSVVDDRGQVRCEAVFDYFLGHKVNLGVRQVEAGQVAVSGVLGPLRLAIRFALTERPIVWEGQPGTVEERQGEGWIAPTDSTKGARVTYQVKLEGDRSQQVTRLGLDSLKATRGFAPLDEVPDMEAMRDRGHRTVSCHQGSYRGAAYRRLTFEGAPSGSEVDLRIGKQRMHLQEQRTPEATGLCGEDVELWFFPPGT
ncbi:MAG: hypothetical protein AB1758_09295 [Candidatus Eremiobacterota bacterium]